MERRLVFIVLNKVEKFEKLVIALNDAGFHGTSINTVGLAQELAKNEDSHIIASLRAFMTAGRTENKTIFTVIPSSRLCDLKKVVQNVIGDINDPNTGIMFSVPVDFAEGLCSE